MKKLKLVFSSLSLLCTFTFACASTGFQHYDREPHKTVTIVGGGIVGVMEAYQAFQDAQKSGQTTQIVILEKNPNLQATTSANIFPSLTPDEIMSVVPRGKDLVEFLKIPFSQGKGIRVDDAPGVNGTAQSKAFIKAVQKYGEQEAAHLERSKTLLEFGRYAMELWKEFYNNADSELKTILDESNFHACYETQQSEPRELHDGYRIDLIFDDKEAKSKAASMKESYQALGYEKTQLLSPEQVRAIDSPLADFVDSHSLGDEASKSKVWNVDAAAVWRPGGCINTHDFLPKFTSYLKNKMGTFTDKDGQKHDLFEIRYENKVKKVFLAEDKKTIRGLEVTANPSRYSPSTEESEYIFAPGEAVGTLKTLGFNEPSYARFAGPSLVLNIPLPVSLREKYSKLSHCMEVHQEGVVLAWQVRSLGDHVLIGVAGTKAFYADKQPLVTQQFARNRNLLQLNIINNVFPELISQALDKDTKSMKLSEDDLTLLEKNKIARRWVGTRAVAYDGFPTLGDLYLQKNGNKILNARATTHLGSGGVSFSLGAVDLSRKSRLATEKRSKLEVDVLNYASTLR